jgi:hypothetical protein
MIFKHKQFTLDDKIKRVFDENGRELRLTGNAYRMLEFLCEKKNANLTEIGDFFDWAKDYTENHIRQYRYKINTIIGADIVEYKNGIYSLTGNIEKTEKSDRITDLLQQDSIGSRKGIMEKIKGIKFTPIPAITAIVLLLLSFLSLPYGYYVFLRLAVTAVAVYYAYYLYTKDRVQAFWFWLLVVMAILFNPIAPIYLGDKSVWGVIDVAVAIFLGALIIKFNKK